MDEQKQAAFVADKLELYSNSIVAFSVIQSLAYAFYFGNDCEFNTVIKTAPFLAEFLLLMFILVAVFGAFGVVRIGHELAAVVQSQSRMLRKMAFAKVCVIVFFMALPIFLTVAYGMVGSATSAICAPDIGSI